MAAVLVGGRGSEGTRQIGAGCATAPERAEQGARTLVTYVTLLGVSDKRNRTRAPPVSGLCAEERAGHSVSDTALQQKRARAADQSASKGRSLAA